VNREPITQNELENLLLLLAPFAPHITEELWQIVHSSQFTVHGNNKKNTVNRKLKAKHTDNWSVHLAPWPKYDAKLAEAQDIVLVVEVNGKVRDKITVARGIGREEAEKLALTSEKVTKYLPKGKPKKVIFVPDRLVNFVV
jgi:leucyl-tRNA synthetase